MQQVIPFTHTLLEKCVTSNDTVIDATAGNGHDTVFLAGISAHVHAFDIQTAALNKTKKRLEEANYHNVTLHKLGHEHLDTLKLPPLKAAVFNLGYLPGGDKTLTTKRATSLAAIKQAMAMVLTGGIVAITLYPGHPEGKAEAALIEAYARAVDPRRFSVLKYQFMNTTDAPFSLIIKKIGKD